MDEQNTQADTKVIELEKPARQVTIRRYRALEGWDMRAAAIAYSMTDVTLPENRVASNAFTLEVLSAATVDGKPLDNAKAVDETLKGWQEIKFLFNEILAFNDIDAEVRNYATKEIHAAGVKMAVAMASQFETMATLGAIVAAGKKEGE